MTAAADAGYDPITEEVVRASLRQITNEMVTVMKRTSGNPVLIDGNDFSVQLFSGDGELIESPPLSPYHIGTSSLCVRHLLSTFRDEDIRPGDVFLTNDPYVSTGHANDFQLATPVFVDDARVAWCFTQAHMMDIGGVNAGSWAVDATDCFGEALRVPPVKIIDEGCWNSAIEQVIAENVRMPAMLLNDLRSIVSTNEVGRRRLTALIRRYGIDDFARYTRRICDRSEALARERISKLPDGVYDCTNWQEHNGHRNDLFQVDVRIEIRGEELIVTCVGEPQTDGLINASPPAMAGFTLTTMLMVLLADVPINDGALRPIIVRATPATTVCAAKPAPLSSGHIDGAFKVGTMTVSLLTEILAASDDAESRAFAIAPFGQSWGAAPFAGLDDNGVFTVFMDMNASGVGAGANARLDGLDVSGAMAAPGMLIPDIESNEQAYPVLYLWRRLAADSGGPGEHRGGVGIDSAFVLWGASALSGTVNASGWQIPVPGAMGGYPGGANKFERINGLDARRAFSGGNIPRWDEVADGDSIEAKASGVRLTSADLWRAITPGGGGYGDPLLRDPAAVVRDVALGAVSAGQAEQTYRVRLSDDAAGYDASATEALRASAFRDRIGADSGRESGGTVGTVDSAGADAGRSPLHAMIDLVTTGARSSAVCVRCGHTIAAGPDWRSGTHVVTRNLGDWAAASGVAIQGRDDTNLIERSCPSCGLLFEAVFEAPKHLGDRDPETRELRTLW
jgi:N-methylhydantoinase B